MNLDHGRPDVDMNGRLAARRRTGYLALMIRFILCILLFALVPASLPATVETRKPSLTVHAAERKATPGLASDIAQAPADALFLVQLRFAEPITVGQLQSFVERLDIARAFGQATGPRTRHSQLGALVKLGSMYPSGLAARYNECTAQLAARYLGFQESIYTEDWLISEIYANGNAHQIRELIGGGILPPADVTYGRPQSPKELERLAAHERDSLTNNKQVIEATFDAPAVCEPFVQVPSGPVLSGSDQELMRYSYGDMLEHMETLSLDTGVTITFQLADEDAGNEAVAAMVERYRIDGLTVELEPSWTGNIMAIGEYSVHGAPLGKQIERTECSMRLSERREPPPAGVESRWTAGWITLSAGAQNALQFLRATDVQRVRWTARYPMSQLDSIAEYHERRSSTPTELNGFTAIPSGCEAYYSP